MLDSRVLVRTIHVGMIPIRCGQGYSKLDEEGPVVWIFDRGEFKVKYSKTKTVLPRGLPTRCDGVHRCGFCECNLKSSKVPAI